MASREEKLKQREKGRGEEKRRGATDNASESSGDGAALTQGERWYLSSAGVWPRCRGSACEHGRTRDIVDGCGCGLPTRRLPHRFLAQSALKSGLTCHAAPAESFLSRCIFAHGVRTYSPRTGTMGMGQPTWYEDGTVQAITKSGVRLKVGGPSLEELAVPSTLPLGFVSPDGRTLYARASAVGMEIFDVPSGAPSGSVAVPKDWRPVALSPDGRTFALWSLDPKATAKLAVMGVDGTDFRPMSASISGRIVGQEAGRPVRWTSDGSALFVAVSTGDDLSAIQRVSVAGGPAVTISANIRGLRAFDISPDERRIAYSIDRPTTDVWLLDLKAALK